MIDPQDLVSSLGPMTPDVAVRPEADRRQRFLQQLDDVSTMIDDARTALVECRGTDRQALEAIARGLLLLVEAIEAWVGSEPARS